MFARLEAENQVLRVRTSILERVVDCRDTQLKVLQSSGDESGSGGGGRAAATPEAEGLSCSSSRGSGATAAGGSSAPADTVSAAAAAVAAAAAGGGADAVAAAMASAGGNSLPTMEEMASYQSMSIDDIKARWKRFCHDVSPLLLALESPNPDPSVELAISTHVGKLGAVMRYVTYLSPDSIYKLMAINLETGKPMQVRRRCNVVHGCLPNSPLPPLPPPPPLMTSMLPLPPPPLPPLRAMT